MRLLPRLPLRNSRGLCEARFNEILSSLSKVKSNLSKYAISWQKFQGILHWVDFSCFLLENVWQLFFFKIKNSFVVNLFESDLPIFEVLLDLFAVTAMSPEISRAGSPV